MPTRDCSEKLRNFCSLSRSESSAFLRSSSILLVKIAISFNSCKSILSGFTATVVISAFFNDDEKVTIASESCLEIRLDQKKINNRSAISTKELMMSFCLRPFFSLTFLAKISASIASKLNAAPMIHSQSGIP